MLLTCVGGNLRIIQFDTLQMFISELFLFSLTDLNESLHIVSRESTLVTFGELRAGAPSASGAWRSEGDGRVHGGDGDGGDGGGGGGSQRINPTW